MPVRLSTPDPTGARVRERRLALGLRQADLARRIGISASYLNLIEHDRRRIAGKRLRDLARALGVAPEALTAGAGETLVAQLREAAASCAPAPTALEPAEEFAERFPGWASVLAATQGRAVALSRSVEALSERLAHDPQLSTSLHEVLSAVTAIRATAAILAETEDIDPDWRRRFLRNLGEDSRRLGDGAQALAAHLEAAPAPGAAPSQTTPQEEAEQWLARRGWRFAVPADEEDPSGAWPNPEAAALLRRWTARAEADARALPDAALESGLAAGGPDPVRLAQAAGVGLPVALRRIALAAGSEAGLLTCDGSGVLTFRKPFDGLSLPRFGVGCPLWPLYRALTAPGQPVRAVLELPGQAATRALAFAAAEVSHPEGFDGPAVVEATMLILRERELPAPPGPALPVGVDCRICPRARCPARREASLIRSAL